MSAQEKPIIFSSQMVRAILDGKKTQTRRIQFRGEVGDLLWVRESLSVAFDLKFRARPNDSLKYTQCGLYQADDKESIYPWPWKRQRLPAMFMPKKLARIWLRVIAVREEKLQDISTDDVISEGFNFDFVNEFIEYWDKLYVKKPQQMWARNPVVGVITFEKEKP